MKRSTILSTILLATVFVVGCSDQTAPTASSEGTPTLPSSLAKSPPAVSGIVIRFAVNAGASLAFFDAARELVTVLSVDNGLLGCTAITQTSPINFQIVNSPTGAVQRLVKGQALFVTVYDATGLPPFPPLTCPFLTGATGRLLAQGAGNFLNTDNNVPVAGPGANAFAFRSNGTLQLVGGGGQVNFRLTQQFLIKPNGSFVPLVGDIVLTPDPR